MSRRDGDSPNENRAPTTNMSRDEEGTSSVPAKRPRLTIPGESDGQESSTSKGRIDVAGRVASVKLQNFMCHANLQIDFNTLKNNCFYIGGPNGSGKSALFAAINLGLGGRGSDNDRGSTVKSYIKDGTTQAKITISLTNTGLNSHPDFDELITIERTINQTSSTYVMRSVKVSSHGNESEKIISKKKCDIDRIINRFNIHLANPAFWMSQDRSRSFLANFKPGNVYKLYLESTNLENIRQSYMRFAEVMSDCNDMVTEKRREVELESKKLKRMQEQRELQAKLESDKLLLRSYQWKFLFCPLRDYDSNILINEKKQKLQKKIHEECKAEYAQNRAERGIVEKSIQDVCDEVELLKEDVEEARTIRAEKLNALDTLQESARAVMNQIKSKESQLKAVDVAVEKNRQRLKLALSKGKGNAHLTEKLTNVENNYNRIAAERSKLESSGEQNRLSSKESQLDKEMKAMGSQVRTTEASISVLENEKKKFQILLDRSRATKQNSLNKYGYKMAEIVSLIDKREKLFDRMPIGPLGKYITLKDAKWAYAVEECMKNLANNFLCVSNKDAKTLQQIFDELRLPAHYQPAVIKCTFQGKCYPNLKEPSDNFNSLYRMLSISDPDVNNAVIDKTSCEKILLIENNQDAMKIMGSNNPPQNVRRAYTLDGSQAYANTNNSQYRFYRGRGEQPDGTFVSEERKIDEEATARKIKQLEEQISKLKSKDLAQNKKDYSEIQKELQKTQSDAYEFTRKLTDLRREELNLGRILEDLKREISNTENDEDVVGEINDTIEELKKKIPVIEKEREELKKKLKDIETQIVPVQKQKNEADKNLSDMQEEIDAFDSKTSKLNEKLSKFDEKYDVLTSRIHKLKNDEHVLYHEEAKLKSERDQAIEDLETQKKRTEKPPGDQDPADLSDFPPTDDARKIILELGKKIERASEGCDMTITFDTVKEFKESITLRKHRCRCLTTVIDNLRLLHDARVKAYPSLREFTDMKVKEKFKELLAVRGHFLGGLDMDHANKALNVNVKSCKTKDAMADGDGAEEILDETNAEEEERSSEDYSGSESDDDSPRRKKAKKQDSKKKKKKETRDLKGLSGGERSFVTAALVMSLWEVMEQPFRMMDEFDVFMDMMNRKLVMDLLVELATKKFPHNQFIFFTPQGIKELNKVDGLQVFEMNKVRE
ncbi:unnamed protein product [Caenorhabditis brenneri]